MKIVVLAKQVPDTWSDRHLDMVTGIVDRSSGEQVPDEITERALEVALQHRDAAGDDAGIEVIALSMGPTDSSSMLRKLLATGADSAVLISDESLSGADAMRTAGVLAAAVQKMGADLVITGDQSTDGGTGVVPAMLAELTGAGLLPGCDELTISSERVGAKSSTDGAVLDLETGLPAVVSVTDQAPEPRLVKFTQIMAAKKKPLATWGLDELGEPVTTGAASSVMVSAHRREPKAAGVVVNAADDAAAVEKLADFLSARRPN